MSVKEITVPAWILTLHHDHVSSKKPIQIPIHEILKMESIYDQTQNDLFVKWIQTKKQIHLEKIILLDTFAKRPPKEPSLIDEMESLDNSNDKDSKKNTNMLQVKLFLGGEEFKDDSDIHVPSTTCFRGRINFIKKTTKLITSFPRTVLNKFEDLWYLVETDRLLWMTWSLWPNEDLLMKERM